MTKKQLIKLLSYKYDGLSTSVIQLAVDVILERMCQAFASKEEINIRGFGAFTTKTHKGKIIRHPTTRRLVKLTPHNVVHFKTHLSGVLDEI